MKETVFNITITLSNGSVIEGNFYSLFFDEQRRNIVLMEMLPADNYKTIINRYILPYKDVVEFHLENENNKQAFPRC